MDSNAIFAILLLLVGLVILVSEVFIPSGGLLGIITFCTLVVSVVFAYRAWGTSNPKIFAVFCVMLLLLVPIALGFAFYMLPRTSFGKRVLLEAPTPQEVTPYSKEQSRLENLVGRHGTSLTMLNPGGLVKVDGERLHAVSQGLMVESGTPIIVVSVDGLRIVVRPGQPTENAEDQTANSPAKDSTSFDFDFPTET